MAFNSEYRYVTHRNVCPNIVPDSG